MNKKIITQTLQTWKGRKRFYNYVDIKKIDNNNSI